MLWQFGTLTDSDNILSANSLFGNLPAGVNFETMVSF